MQFQSSATEKCGLFNSIIRCIAISMELQSESFGPNRELELATFG